MAKRLGFIWILVTLILLSSANAVIDDPVRFYSIDDDERSGNNIIDQNDGLFNLTNVGYTLGSTVSCGVNECANLATLSNQRMDYSYNTDLGGDDTFTISFWANVTDVSEVPILFSDSLDQYNLYAIVLGTGDIRVQRNSADANARDDTATGYVTSGSKHYYTFSFDSSTTVKVYKDGANQQSLTIADTPATLGVLHFGIYHDESSFDLRGSIDEISIYNRSLSALEVEALYNATNAGEQYPYTTPPPATGSITLLNQTPNNNTQFNTTSVDFELNLSLTTNSSLTTYCNLTLNTVIEHNANFTGNGSKRVTTTEVGTNGLNNYTWYCENTEANLTTTQNSFYIDTVFPNIASDFANNSFVLLGNNVEGQFNFTDDQSIFSYNISIDGITYNYLDNILNTTHQVNFSNTTTGLSAGQHTLSVALADGHTANKIKTQKVTESNYLEFELDGKKIKIENELYEPQDKFTATKLIDRYTYDFEPDKLKSSYTFRVSADADIHIMDVPDTPYKKWLVIDNRWVDFYTDEGYVDLDIKRVSDKEVKVTVDLGKIKDKISFRSIGELNVQTANYTFYVINYTSQVIGDILEGQPVRYNLSLVSSNLSLFTITPILVFNGSSQGSATLVSNDGTTAIYYDTVTMPTITNLNLSVNSYWNVTINASNFSTSTDTQTLYQTRIDDCSDYNTNSLNFTFRSFPDDALVASDADFNVEYRNLFSVSRNQTNQTSSATYSEWCIYPAWTTIYADFWVEYTAPGYNTFSSYTFNTTMDNTSNEIKMYLRNGTQAITYTVTDDNDDPVESAYITVQEYDPTSGNFIQTQVLKTDYLGNAIGQGILNDVWYKFIISYQGDVKLSTGATKLITNSRTFRISLSEFSFVDRFTDVMGIQSSLQFNDVAEAFTFTFVDNSATISAGCLKIVKRNAARDTVISDSCVNATSGTVVTAVGNYTGQNTFIATGYVHFDEEFILETLTETLGRVLEGLGTAASLFMSFLLIVTLGFVGIWSPVIAVIMVTVGLVVTSLLGIFVMGWQYIMLTIILGGLTAYKLSQK